MPRRLSPLSAVALFSTGLALLLCAAPSRPQDRKVILPSDGEATLSPKSAPFKEARERFEALRKRSGEGGEKATREDQPRLDLMAQYYTYRLTWEQRTADSGGVNTLMEEFNGQVKVAHDLQKENPDFTAMYLKALALRARDVIQTRQPIAAVNGARMLSRLAEEGLDEAGDACLDAIKDTDGFLEPKARAGVQYYALQGLKNLLTAWGQPTPAGADAPAIPAGRKEREARYLQALIEVIERKPPPGTNLSVREEVEGLRVFRREAVRALAQHRAPGLADAKGAITVRTAQALLKVVNDDGLVPSARLDEQIEAAVGVARMDPKALPAYQPDYAAQQLGGLVVRVASRAVPAKDNKEKFPWKLHAARLSDALETMRADLKGYPDKEAIKYIDQMMGPSLKVLKDVETKEQANATNLNDFLVNVRPPHDTVYKGLADSAVRPPRRGDEPDEPEKKPDDKKPEDKKPADKPGEKKPEDKPKKPEDKKPGKP